MHLVQERKLEPKSVMVQMAALRFLYLKVLRRSYSRDDIPLPRVSRRRIPIVLSTDEVRRLIDAAPNLRYRTILMTLYDTGMRRAELCQLRPEHVDKERMMIRIPRGKGGKAREVPLSSQLREQLRTYYRSLPRRNGWMFPSLASKRANDPITDKVVWHACHESTRRAGITKPVHPHTLRHASAYCTTFQSPFILKTIGLGRARFAGVYGRLDGPLSLVPAPPVTASHLSG